MTSPYLLTHAEEHLDGWCPLSREAFTTLEGARRAALNIGGREQVCDHLPPAGALLYLPDGSTLSVMPVTAATLWRGAGGVERFGMREAPLGEVVAAWNAKHATQGKEASDRA